MSLLLSLNGYHQDLHSFPTRRSSDLEHATAQGPHPERGTTLLERDEEKDQQRQRHAQHGAAEEEKADGARIVDAGLRSEEHTSELQSRRDLVCRLLLEKKK